MNSNNEITLKTMKMMSFLFLGLILEHLIVREEDNLLGSAKGAATDYST